MGVQLVTRKPGQATVGRDTSLMATPRQRAAKKLARPTPARWGFVALARRIVPAVSLATLMFAAIPAEAETSLSRLRAETRDLLRQEANASEGLSKDAAAEALCDMYVILRKDPRYENSEMLRGDATKIRRRLLTIAQKRQAALRRKGVSRPESLASEVDSAIELAVKESETREAGQPSQKGSLTRPPGSSSGQPAGQGGGAFADEGWRLVELIQRVVAPDFWDSRGGPGAIHYFAMRRVLVVRATTDVHEQIKDLLMALR